MDHSLTAAVADGTITDQDAYCGLTPAHVEALAIRHPSCELLVRLRSREGDGRTILRATDLAAWVRSLGPLMVNRTSWLPSDIRDVFGCAANSCDAPDGGNAGT
jgi:hypothetical protein